MPRNSSIRSLPPDKLEKLQALLRDPRFTHNEIVAEINTLLEQDGDDVRISKSSLNRYKLQMDKVGAKLQQSREIADMWISKLGSQPQGQIGHLLNEMMRTLSFDLMLTLQQDGIDEESLPGFIEALKGLSLTLMRLEKAAGDNVKRDQIVREQAMREAADTAAKIARQGGLSPESVTELRTAILGIKS
jgi:hypothetical protein